METLLKKISADIGVIKNELLEIREEIDSLREVKPRYLKKLKRIEKNGESRVYSSIKELRKAIENA